MNINRSIFPYERMGGPFSGGDVTTEVASLSDIKEPSTNVIYKVPTYIYNTAINKNYIFGKEFDIFTASSATENFMLQLTEFLQSKGIEENDSENVLLLLVYGMAATNVQIKSDTAINMYDGNKYIVKNTLFPQILGQEEPINKTFDNIDDLYNFIDTFLKTDNEQLKELTSLLTKYNLDYKYTDKPLNDEKLFLNVVMALGDIKNITYKYYIWDGEKYNETSGDAPFIEVDELPSFKANVNVYESGEPSFFDTSNKKLKAEVFKNGMTFENFVWALYGSLNPGENLTAEQIIEKGKEFVDVYIVNILPPIEDIITDKFVGIVYYVTSNNSVSMFDPDKKEFSSFMTIFTLFNVVYVGDNETQIGKLDVSQEFEDENGNTITRVGGVYIINKPIVLTDLSNSRIYKLKNENNEFEYYIFNNSKYIQLKDFTSDIKKININKEDKIKIVDLSSDQAINSYSQPKSSLKEMTISEFNDENEYNSMLENYDNLFKNPNYLIGCYSQMYRIESFNTGNIYDTRCYICNQPTNNGSKCRTDIIVFRGNTDSNGNLKTVYRCHYYLGNLITEEQLLGHISNVQSINISDSQDGSKYELKLNFKNYYKKDNFNYTTVDESIETSFPKPATWMNSSGVPSYTIGINGDYCFDTTNKVIYTKENGVWVSIVDLKGNNNNFINVTMDPNDEDSEVKAVFPNGTYKAYPVKPHSVWYQNNWGTPPVITREGYTFKGWSSTKQYTVTSGLLTDYTYIHPDATDFTVYAIWEKNA